MASEDVIELGSSDEESRPAKKMRAGPNTMVHIPDSLHGVTIKPTKAFVGPGGVINKITNIGNTIPIPNRNIAKTNGKKLQAVTKKNVTLRKDLQKGIPVTGKVNKTLGVNPVTLMKKLNSSQIIINKLPSNINVLKAPIPVMKGPINLPSSITIKKTSNTKRPAACNISGVKKKQICDRGTREVLTIDSDDEEIGKAQSAKPAGPQWYLRPEEQNEFKNREEQNNSEPETPKFIEITIEDSPVKPVKDKRTCKVDAELAITIDDSPVKPKEISSSDKNTESANKPHSKKKLEYPVETFEIEIEPMEVMESNLQSRNVHEPQKDPLSNLAETAATKEHNNDHSKEEVNSEQKKEIFEVADSPAKKQIDKQISGPKEVPSKVIDLDFEEEVSTSTEFHPVYQQFIDLCLKIEDSVDMKTIVEKKIKSYYRQVPKDYSESEEFIDLVSGKILSMKAGPDKIYLYIKDVVDELNMQRKLAKQQAVRETKKKSVEEEKFLYGEDTEFDSKRQRQIRKLEKTLKKLHRAIQKLEEQEVDFDDEEDSVYLLTERYKERMVRVHAKLCQLTNTKMPSEPRVQIDARLGQPSGPAKRLEKWVNKKVPIGTPLPFPDFHDVLRCVREANEEDKLGWNEADIMEEARDLFMRCGKKLQRRRQENEWRLAASRISVDVDPAEENEGLKKKLEENRQLATKKETEVFNKFADRQSILKLEPEVVGDKEAEESPVESEEEEEPFHESCTMQNKKKRKERLRRLIQEKPRNSDKNSSSLQKELDINESVETNKRVIDNISNASNVEKENEKLETETKAQEESKDVKKIKPKEVEKIHSISDSSDNVGSDVDELHLLQKLHSGNEVDSSTSESSTSLIDISDTIQSDNDNSDKVQSDDVISIENSSYSDSEHSNDAKNNKRTCDDVHKSSLTTKSTESQANLVEKEPDEEKMLLTESDEDRPSKEDNESQGSDVVCMNTQDDAISIGDTEVQRIEKTTTKTESEMKSISKSHSLEPKTCKKTCSGQEKNINDDEIEIASSSNMLKTQPNIDLSSDLPIVTQDSGMKVDDQQDLHNEDQSRGSNESNLKEDEIVLNRLESQDTDILHTTEVAESKINDEQVLIKESGKGKDKDENHSPESNLRLNKDEIMVNEVRSQYDYSPAEVWSEVKNTSNSNITTNKGGSYTEIDKLNENNKEPLSSKFADANVETCAISNDEKKQSVESGCRVQTAFKDIDLSEDNKNIDFKQTDSLEHMLEEFRSDLEANEG